MAQVKTKDGWVTTNARWYVLAWKPFWTSLHVLCVELRSKNMEKPVENIQCDIWLEQTLYEKTQFIPCERMKRNKIDVFIIHRRLIIFHVPSRITCFMKLWDKESFCIRRRADEVVLTHYHRCVKYISRLNCIQHMHSFSKCVLLIQIYTFVCGVLSNHIRKISVYD